MARLRVVPITTVRTGVLAAPSTALQAADGGVFANGTDEKTGLRVNNPTAGSIDLLFTPTKTVDALVPAVIVTGKLYKG